MSSKKGLISAMAAHERSEHDYQAEDDLRRLEHAHEVHSDKGRLNRARAFAKKKAGSLQQIALGRSGFTRKG